MLLSTGERISCALCAMAINDLGHRAISLTGSQAGIVTDTSHMRRARRLLEDAGFDVLPAPVRVMDAPRQPGERIRLFHETLRESLALLYYGVAGYR